MAVSVKCRIGVHDTLRPDGTVPEDSYDELREFVSTVSEGTACSHVVVHARAAILGGLSPSKNRRVPPLRHDYVRQLARDCPGLRVTLNGGLALDGAWRDEVAWGGEHIDGVMLGRSVLSRPLDLWGVDVSGDGTGRAPSRAAAIERYARYACDLLATRDHGRGAVHAAEVIAPLTLVAQQLADEEEAATVDGACDASGEGSSGSGLLQPGERRDVFEAVWEGAASLLSEGAKGRMKKAPPPASIILSEADAAGEGLPTRQLVRMLDRGMSKKEASKLARNRAEALL